MTSKPKFIFTSTSPSFSYLSQNNLQKPHQLKNISKINPIKITNKTELKLSQQNQRKFYSTLSPQKSKKKISLDESKNSQSPTTSPAKKSIKELRKLKQQKSKGFEEYLLEILNTTPKKKKKKQKK